MFIFVFVFAKVVLNLIPWQMSAAIAQVRAKDTVYQPDLSGQPWKAHFNLWSGIARTMQKMPRHPLPKDDFSPNMSI